MAFSFSIYLWANQAKMRGTKAVIIIFSILFLSCSRTMDTESGNTRKKLLTGLLLDSKSEDFNLVERLKRVDSAFHLSNEHHPDSLALAIIYSKSFIHYKLHQEDSTAYYDLLLRIKAQEVSNGFFLGKAHANLGFGYRDSFVYDSAFFHFNRSKNIFESLGDQSETGKRLLSMAITQQMKSDFFGSKETLTEALTYLDDKKDKASVASAYNELATNHRRLLNPKDAIISYQKAIQLSDSKSAIATFENNLAASLIDDSQYDKAITILTRLSKTLQEAEPTAKYARVLDNLVYAHWRNRSELQVELFSEALQIRKKLKDKRGQLASYKHLGEYHSKSNSFLAKKYLDTLLQLSRQLKIPNAEAEGLKLLMELEPKNSSFKDRYIILKDSTYHEELRVKTQFAKMKYDDEQEKQQILKLETETAQKQSDLVEEKAKKVMFLSLSGLLLIGGTFFYYVLRLRHKKEKLREVYTTEKRISKKVHDELANDIYGVMTTMEHSKTFQKETVLDNLDDIYKRTRDISHQTGDVETENYEEELKKLLSQFISDTTSITVKDLNTISWNGVSDEKKIVLYRVLNELLVNMKKHSSASLVSIRFENFKKEIKIDYADNGKGVKKPIEKGVGLLNTENRMKNIDGTFSFESELGKGVRINLTLPV